MQSIYTKKGDFGHTSLLGGRQVPKSDTRVATYGTFDEMGCVLGLARIYAVCSPGLILSLQQRNFALCGELAGADSARLDAPIDKGYIAMMEEQIDRIASLIPMEGGFTLPVGNAASGFLHQARTIARRGERLLVAIRDDRPLRPEIFQYVNRLSDLLYMLAREEEFIQAVYSRVKSAVPSDTPGQAPAGSGSLLYDIAGRLIEAGMAKAGELGVPMVLAVVDGGGHLVAYRRMPDSLLASIEVAQDKAFTAAALRMPTAEISETIPLAYELNVGGMRKIAPIGGGYPLYDKEELIGGFGISGGTIEEDMSCAVYALGRLQEEHKIGRKQR